MRCKRHFFWLFPLLISLSYQPANAASDVCIEYSDYLIEAGFTSGLGYMTDIVPAGDIAFAADKGLKVLDISDPNQIEILGSVDFGDWTEKLAVTGSYVYATNGWDGIVIVDVSDPANPQLVGETGIDGFAEDIEVRGDYAYVTGMYNTLTVIDVSDVHDPHVVTELQPWHHGRKLAVSGNYALVCYGDLDVVNISNPMAPHRVGRMSAAGFNANCVAASGSIAYVANQGKGLEVVSFANPANPVAIGSVPIQTECWDIEVAGIRLLYVAGNKVIVIDVSVPSNPVIAGEFNYRGGVRHAAIQGDFFYTSSTEGIHCLDMSNPHSPTRISTVQTPGWAQSAYVANDIAYVANGFGLLSIDVSDPETPVIIGEVDTPGGSNDLAVVGNRAWVADYTNGVQIVDISEPGSPRLSSSIPVESTAVGIAAKGRHVLVADRYYGLQVFDTVHVSHPRRVAGIELPGQTWKVSVNGDIALVCCSYSGLNIIDVSRPNRPRLLSRIPPDTYSTGSNYADAVLSGTSIITATWDGQMRVFDIVDPQVPTLISETRVTRNIRSMIVVGDIVYLGGDRGMEVVDISDASAPRRVNIAPMYSAVGLTAYKGLIFVSDSSRGFHVMPPQCAGDGAPPVPVNVVIRSGPAEPTVNDRSDGIVTAAVLSDAVFDATTIDHRSVSMGPFGAREIHTSHGDYLRHELDVDKDGRTDLVFHFRVPDLGFDCAEKDIHLSGSTFDGMPVEGKVDLDCRHLEKTLGGADAVHGRTGFTGIRPNPFNPRTEISFELMSASEVELLVYDLSGRLARTLIRGFRDPGHHLVAWDGRDDHGRMSAAGVYICVLRSADEVNSARITLLK